MLRKHYQSLHKEDHDLLQATAFKAERCNTTLETHSQHTDGEKRKRCFTMSHHVKKSGSAVHCQYIQKNILLTNT